MIFGVQRSWPIMIFDHEGGSFGHEPVLTVNMSVVATVFQNRFCLIMQMICHFFIFCHGYTPDQLQNHNGNQW